MGWGREIYIFDISFDQRRPPALLRLFLWFVGPTSRLRAALVGEGCPLLGRSQPYLKLRPTPILTVNLPAGVGALGPGWERGGAEPAGPPAPAPARPGTNV